MLTSLLLLAADPSDHTAQQWAENELAKSKYHEQETLLQRIIDWISELFSANIMAVGNRGTVTILLTVLVIIAAAVIALLVWRSVRARTGAASSAQLGSVGSQALFGDARSSDQLFAAAAQAQREHNYDMSVIELFRAVIRLLSERGELTLRPGLTATEAAEAAADKMGHRELFMRGAAWFNEVFFADLHADERSLADLEELADFVRSASSGSASSGSAGSGSTPHAHSSFSHANSNRAHSSHADSNRARIDSSHTGATYASATRRDAIHGASASPGSPTPAASPAALVSPAASASARDSASPAASASAKDSANPSEVAV